MALAMSYVSEVMRQFPTTVLVEQEQWAELMTLFKFEPSTPFCILDRMTFRPAVGGFKGLQERLGALVTENEALTAKVTELEAQLEKATAPASA